jgi:transposase
MRALAWKQDGWPQRAIAEALDVSEPALSQWLTAAERGGAHALRSRHVRGRTCRLTADQKRRIPEFLWHGADAYGFRGEVWTCARIAQVLKEEFGLRYHKNHVGRLLKGLGWTPQMPIRWALQRDGPGIQRWRDEIWPDLLRQSRRERRVLVFEDESGFYLPPGLVRTYAPRGLTPVLREQQSRDHLSVMGGMTPQGKIYTLVRQESLNGDHSIEFLIHLQKVAGSRLLVIWGGSPIHRRAAVQEFIAGTQGKIRVEALPGYAADLNPWDEGGWNHLKHVQMRNPVCRDLEELHEQFHLAIGRLRKRPHVVRSFFLQAGLEI